MTIRVAYCEKCGESELFDSYPYDDGPEADDRLEQMFRSEEWFFDGADEYCPDHKPKNAAEADDE